MTILVDYQIEKRCIAEKIIEPFDPSLVNPSSLDVRLGNNIKLESKNGFKDIDISLNTKLNPFLLKPNEFCLGETWEILNIPNDLSVLFRLKSSRAREGIEHLDAGWVDPGFHNSRLTLEIKNSLQYKSLELYPGLKFGQLIFFKLLFKPKKSYKEVGRYNNTLKVTTSKG